jgi:hypothetical protein
MAYNLEASDVKENTDFKLLIDKLTLEEQKVACLIDIAESLRVIKCKLARKML